MPTSQAQSQRIYILRQAAAAKRASSEGHNSAVVLRVSRSDTVTNVLRLS